MLRAPHQTRFAFWTSDRGDFISPWTLDRVETSLSPRTPIDQAYAAMDLHEGYAPVDRSGASAPLPHGQPSRLDAALNTGGCHEQ